MRQKGFVQIIVIILVVLAVISGIYYFGIRNKTLKTPIASVQPSSTPIVVSTPDPVIANWKIYTNSKLGFSFKYPITYSFEQNQNSFSVTSPLLPVTKGYAIRDGELKVDFSFLPSTKDDTLEKYMDESKPAFDSDILSDKKIALAGNEAVHRIYATGGESWFFIHNDFRYRIDKYPINTTRNDEFNQILSTFKFTK